MLGEKEDRPCRKHESERAMHSLYISAAHSTTPLLRTCTVHTFGPVRATFRGHRSGWPHLTFMDSAGARSLGGKFVVPLHANFLARPFAREVVCAKNDVLLRNSPPRSSDDHRHLWVSGFRWRPRPPTTTLPTQRNGRCICPSSVCTHEDGAMLMLNTPIGGRLNGIPRTVFE